MEKIMAEFESDGKLLSATVRLLVDKENETFADKIFSALAINWPHYLCNNILRIGSSSGEFQFIRKDCFFKLGGYDGTLTAAEDNEMFRRIAKIGKTKIFYNLIVYHTGRRFHKLGWMRILWLWTLNFIYVILFRKSFSKEWKPVR
jgi:glycosyltransferase involved in cell wall biosynthesis